MKLSEALRLGSLLVPSPREGDITSCGITMALKCVGKFELGGCGRDFNLPYKTLGEVWPWLKEMNARPHVKCPLQECKVLLPTMLTGDLMRDTHSSIVFHPFDWHVMTGEMTIEQLADWIATIEPKEEIPTVPVGEYCDVHQEAVTK